jgi:hypothetical protein
MLLQSMVRPNVTGLFAGTHETALSSQISKVGLSRAPGRWQLDICKEVTVLPVPTNIISITAIHDGG